MLTGKTVVFGENPVPAPLLPSQISCELVPPVVTYRCKCLCFCGGCYSYIVCYSEMETLCCEGTLS